MSAQSHDIVDAASGTRATVSSRAASLRRLIVDGMELVEPTVLRERPPGMAGAVLIPWPNRVEDARWCHHGEQLDLEVTEPEAGHAIHGLLADTDFERVDTTDSAVTLRATIDPAPGYPFPLTAWVTYSVVPDGLVVLTRVRNDGRETAPVAVGAHPYLRIGTATPELLSITVDATHAYVLDERNIPRERFPVAETPWDLRTPRPLAQAPRHATFENARPAGDVRHSLQSAAGDRVELWADSVFRWTQLYVAADFPADDGERTAVAVEPMTAPPNALRTGEGLIWIEPGDDWQASWGVRFHPRAQ
jgi:aldose 1-epimerase